MRLRSMAIFGIGYLVGTRAGRDRYQQIAGSVREVAESDVVRGYVDRALGMARRPLDSADTSDDTSELEETVAEDAPEGDGEESDSEGARPKAASRTRAGRSR